MTDPAPDMLRRQVAGLAALLDLEREAREADSRAALAFVIANRTRLVLPCDVAAVWSAGPGGLRVEAVTAVSMVDQQSPFVRWLTEQVRALPAGEAPILAASGSWSEAPGHALWCRLPGRTAGFVLLRAVPWQDSDRQIAERLVATYGHARAALGAERRSLPRWLRAGGAARRRWLAPAALAVILLAAAFPVRQSAVAPATVAARSPLAVTAPMDGVIAEVMVQPYDMVAADQPLVRFDATMARGRLQVARNSERVAAADLFKTRQRAFADADAGARLEGSAAQLDLHRSEAAYAEELLGRTVIKAERPGLALFSDPEDWAGRPVTVGERIMTLADPAQVQLHIFLPADEAFLLAPGAEVTFFLNIDPLRAIDAALTHVAYEAAPGPEGFLAYRLTADFAPGAVPRIGLKGVATVYGDRVPLARFLFRRPLAVLRQWLHP